MALGVDPHSYANFKEVVVTHLHICLKADFAAKSLSGYVDLTAKVLVDGTQELLLDTNQLEVTKVVDLKENEQPLQFTKPREQNEQLGVPLSIPIPENSRRAGTELKFRVFYSTTERSSGIQWFDPEQTSGKKYPYVYTQGEAILARTYVPCQDTPAVKMPYSITVSVPKPLVAVCSGTPVGNNPVEENGYYSYSYEQKIPIPSYLIAIVAGALEKGSIGTYSSVWTEKELLQQSIYEFSEHTEKFIKAGEELVNIPYKWGIYDVVVLPSAFPYGGMENPCLTFLSSSLLAGDRSLVNVVAHEIAHSWAGNLVTNSNWNDFMMNEGFCVYLERLILAKVDERGFDYRNFEMLLGYYDLIKTCNDDLREQPKFTKLVPDLTGIDPDEAFSKIPYEKGSLLLYYLETKVGGHEIMLKWLNVFYTDNMFGSVSSADFKQHFLNYFKDKVDKSVLDSIDWDMWFTGEGLPDFDPREQLENALSKVCREIANKWLEQDGANCTAEEYNALSSKQKMYMLDLIQTSGKLPMKHDVLEKMDALYRITDSNNVEILCRYLVICLKSKYEKAKEPTAKFLSIHGRGLYVKPLLTCLNEFDHEFAVKVYKANRARYHSVIRNMFDDKLNK